YPSQNIFIGWVVLFCEHPILLSFQNIARSHASGLKNAERNMRRMLCLVNSSDDFSRSLFKTFFCFFALYSIIKYGSYVIFCQRLNGLLAFFNIFSSTKLLENGALDDPFYGQSCF